MMGKLFRATPTIALLFFLASCSGGGDGTLVPPDNSTPLPITDLAVTGGSPGALVLSWTAPQLQTKSSRLINYELRYIGLENVSTPVTAWNLAAAPSADDPGSQHTHTLENLLPDHTYALRLRAVVSGLPSPWTEPVVGTAAVVFDTTAPAQVQGLQWWSSTSHSLTVRWQPSGDDGLFGLAHHYEIRYADEPITDQNWNSAHAVTGAVVPGPGGTDWQTTIGGLAEDVSYQVAASWCIWPAPPFATAPSGGTMPAKAAVSGWAARGNPAWKIV